MATDVDVRTVASFASIPETAVSTLLQSPTVELVQTFLQLVATKAREYDELRSDKLRLDVELESAVRSGEAKVKGLKNSIEKGLIEVGKLRNEVKESGKLALFFAVRGADTDTKQQKMRAQSLRPSSSKLNPPRPTMSPRPRPSNHASLR